MRYSLCGVALLFAAAQLLSAADAELSVEANGLRVVAPQKDDSTRAFGGIAGTTVSLLISYAPGGLIQFDAKNSTLAKCIDEKGNDLLAKIDEKGFFGAPGFSAFPKISNDGKACMIEVNAPRIPAKGSAQVTLQGVVTMLCASEKDERVQQNVALANGTKIALPGIDLTIDKVGKPDWGDERLALTLRATRELDNVAEIKFFKADGSEIKSMRVGTSVIGIFGSMTVEWTYNLKEKADTATIKVYIWKNMQKKRADFKLNVSAGL